MKRNVKTGLLQANTRIFFESIYSMAQAFDLLDLLISFLTDMPFIDLYPALDDLMT